MLSCKEVAHAVSIEDVTLVGWRQRLTVRFHLMMCRHCRRYADQIEALGDAARNVFQQPPEAPENLSRLQSEVLDSLTQSLTPPDSDS